MMRDTPKEGDLHTEAGLFLVMNEALAAEREWRARLERKNAELSDQVMRWFKAASPYATPGSLEGALKALASTLTDACVLIDGFKQGESWSEWDQDVRRRLGEALRILS
jgi:hypothetical protein